MSRLIIERLFIVLLLRFPPITSPPTKPPRSLSAFWALSSRAKNSAAVIDNRNGSLNFSVKSNHEIFLFSQCVALALFAVAIVRITSFIFLLLLSWCRKCYKMLLSWACLFNHSRNCSFGANHFRPILKAGLSCLLKSA